MYINYRNFVLISIINKDHCEEETTICHLRKSSNISDNTKCFNICVFVTSSFLGFDHICEKIKVGFTGFSFQGHLKILTIRETIFSQ